MKVENFLSRLDQVRHSSGRWTARCPAHKDHSPSLSIAEGAAGRIVVHCFAGCSVEEIVEALGLTLGDLFPDTESRPPPPRRSHQQEARRIATRAQATSLRIAAALREIGSRYSVASRALKEFGPEADRELLQSEIARCESAWAVLEVWHDDLADPAAAVELYQDREILESVLGAIDEYGSI
ncbi:MAG: hypothetical protein ACE5JU_24845 [Candidatus Binatia bacterium]